MVVTQTKTLGKSLESSFFFTSKERIFGEERAREKRETERETLAEIPRIKDWTRMFMVRLT